MTALRVPTREVSVAERPRILIPVQPDLRFVVRRPGGGARLPRGAGHARLGVRILPLPRRPDRAGLVGQPGDGDGPRRVPRGPPDRPAYHTGPRTRQPHAAAHRPG